MYRFLFVKRLSLMNQEYVLHFFCLKCHGMFKGEEKEDVDGAGWSEKPVKNWCQEETINWLISAASHMGQSYSSIQHSLAIPGKDLITLTRKDFIAHDSVYGERLYDLLHSQKNSYLTSKFQYTTIQLKFLNGEVFFN